MQRDKTRNTFAVAHDHFRQLETNVIERGLKNFELVRIVEFEFRIFGQSIGQHDHRIVRAHVAIDRDAIETLRDRDFRARA